MLQTTLSRGSLLYSTSIKALCTPPADVTSGLNVGLNIMAASGFESSVLTFTGLADAKT